MEIFKLFGSVFVDNEKANQSIQETDGLGEKLGKTFASGAKVIGAGCVAIGSAATAVGVAAVKSFGDFEQSLNKVSTIADPSVKSMDEIKKEVLSLSNEMGTAAGDINEAMYQAISATGDTANALKYVESASKLAKGGFTDTSTALEAAAKTMNAYGQSGEEAFAKIGDIMMATQNQGITDIGKLSSSLSNVVPIAASLGVSFEQVGASLATMTAQGTETSVATTQLRSAMTELSKSGTKAQQEFEKISGTTFQEFIASGGNVSEAMQLMAQSAEQQGLTMMDLFGSVEAAQAALALTGSGAEKFAESMDAMNNSAGATQEAYDKMSQGVSASFGKLLNAGKNVLIGLGDKLAPAAVALADWINEHMPQIQSVIETVFEVIGTVIDTCVGWIETLIGWFDDLLTNNLEVSGGIEEVWENVQQVFSGVFSKLQELVSAFISWCTKFWDKWGKDITKIIQSTWDLVKGIFGTAFELIGGVVDLFISALNGDFEGMKKATTEIIDSLWEGIKEIFSTSIEWIFTLVPRMFSAGADLVSGLWEGWKSIWYGMQDWIQEKCDWILDKLMFWRKSEAEMSSSKSNTDGSHANGLSYVPFDGYTAQLHVGERVLTREENEKYNNQTRSDEGNGRQIIIQNMSVTANNPMEFLEQLQLMTRARGSVI